MPATSSRPDWDYAEYSSCATGDSGPHVRWLPLAWRAVADPQGAHELPLRPADEPHDLNDDAAVIAWWAPLLQLLLYGLGWPRPDIGLVKWLQTGRPTDDARLALMDRWWGRDVEQAVPWLNAGKGSPAAHLLQTAAESVGSKVPIKPLPGHRYESGPAWRGGSDPMHLSLHAETPVWRANVAASNGHISVAPSSSDQPPYATLVLDSYTGWYRALAEQGSQLPATARSWRIDVIIRPLGWLGTYRRSRQTGRWFAGRHRWHQLGT